ncbi:MAG: Polyphosphate:ADP phosphotransferase [Xylophilus sp.]|nr:MAG: Polyphosphate:ADP phosphotransferase [Xylophilus sp.]
MTFREPHPAAGHQLDPEPIARLREDVLDGLDEEFEMELEDALFDGDGTVRSDASREARRAYFRALFRLQGELVKLQDWVVASGHRLVVLFEGRERPARAGQSSASPSA